MLNVALEYLNKYHFSVIPLKKDKRPLIKWEEYQKRLPTEKEVREWFTKYPDANIGIVTGQLSGIAVIDVDKIGDYGNIMSPMAQTPRGEHYYFQYEEGITNTVNIFGKKCDVRGEGGYVVAPPSINGNGKKYKWIRSLSIGLPEFPMEILENKYPPQESGEHSLTSFESGETFVEGRRDNDLFHVAHLLVKGGMEQDAVTNVIRRLALTCDPPFPPKEAEEKVESAVKRAWRKERPLAQELREWVDATLGWFHVTMCYKELRSITKEDESTIRVYLSRLAKDGVLQKHPTKHGHYRKVEVECLPMDWKNAPTDEFKVKFPLELEDMVSIYPGNIIIIAGEANAGKSAYLLDFIRLNMLEHNIYYFNSEMGASELRIRLELFKDVDTWKFNAFERGDSFADVIRPDDVNIIDFLDITDEFWKVGQVIKDIHAKLNKGIALIALQKNFGRDTGRGGALSLEKPRLYLAMGHGRLKIVKAKNWRGTDNPNGKSIDFKLYQGHEFSAISYWKREGLDKTA